MIDIKTVTLSEDFRRDVWDKITKCERECILLKGIIQNEIPISEEEFDDWNKSKKEVVNSLDNITMLLYNEIIGL